MSQKIIISLLLIILFSCKKRGYIRTIKGEELISTEIDEFIISELDSSNIVGVSVSIVNDDQIVYSGHFGKKSATSEQKIDKQTIYEVASLSKPVFTFFTLKQGIRPFTTVHFLLR